MCTYNNSNCYLYSICCVFCDDIVNNFFSLVQMLIFVLFTGLQNVLIHKLYYLQEVVMIRCQNMARQGFSHTLDIGFVLYSID